MYVMAKVAQVKRRGAPQRGGKGASAVTDGNAAYRLSPGVQPQSVGFADSLDRWMRRRKKDGTWGAETARKVERMAKVWLHFLGGKALDEITPLDLEAIYLHLLDKGCGPWWANDNRKVLRTFWRYALETRQVAQEVFTRQSWPRMRAETNHPEIPFSEADEERFIAALPKKWRRAIGACVRLVLRTALRRKTVYLLTCGMVNSEWWLDVPPEDEEGHRIVKNLEHPRFPLHLFPCVVTALTPLGQPEDPLIPGLPSFSSINRILKRTARAIGLPHAELFDMTELRRIAVSRYLEHDPNPDRARRWFWWKSLDVMNKFYRFRDSDQKREELARGLTHDSIPSTDFDI